MTDISISSELPYRLTNASRFYGPKEMIKQGGPKFELSLISIETQAKTGVELGEETCAKVEYHNYFQWSRSLTGLIGEGEEKDYLIQQIKEYVDSSASWNRKKEDMSLEDALELSFELVSRGTGWHDGDLDGKKLKIQDAFDLSNPPATKCSMFNELFVGSYEIICNLYNPSLLKKHRLIQHSSVAATDLPKIKKGDNDKSADHSFLTLISGKENGWLFTTVDPYHVRKGDDFLSSVDFSQKRKGDSLVGMLALAFANSGHEYGKVGGSSSDENTIALGVMDAIESGLEIKDKAIVGSIMAGTYWPEVLKNYKESAKAFDIKKKEMTRSIGLALAYRETVSERLRHGALNASRDSYNDYNDISYIGIRFRYEAERDLEEMMEKTMAGVVGELMKEIGNKGPTEVDPNLLAYFVDIMDSIGYYDLPVGLEVWDKAIEFVDKDLRESAYKWREYEEKRGEGYDDMFEPINKKSNYNDFRLQFVNKWNHSPTQTYVSNKDLEQIDKNKDIGRLKYTVFKAKVLGRISDFGINGWEVHIPSEAPKGSYGELFLNTLREEMGIIQEL